MDKLKQFAIIGLVTCITSTATPIMATAVTEVNCPGNNQVCRQVTTGLPLRGLPRALSNIYMEPDANAKVLASNVKAFWPVYIFERKDLDFTDGANPKGWYHVGTMDNDPFGWMQAKDLLEWKQALVIAYKHPGSGEHRRKPVLMFKTRDTLAAIAEADDRAAQAMHLYSGLESTPPNVDERLISREPKRFVSIEEKFYMLPVIDFEIVDYFEDETRYLEIAAAIPVQPGNAQQARTEPGKFDTLNNVEFLTDSAQTETVTGTQANELVFDIKFVMDMTGSMGPYIERTKEAIKKVAQTIGQTNPEAKVRYGLIGYRDDLKVVPELEFVAKNFTPELVEAEQFIQLIDTAKPSPVGSADYQEEVFAGLKEALDSSWSDNSIKIAVLVGDASSHTVEHEQNTTGMDAAQIRANADAQKVKIFAMHLQEERAVPDHPLATMQFQTVATNAGGAEPAYIAIDAANHDAFEAAVAKMATTFSDIVAQIRQGNTQIIAKATALQDTASTPDTNSAETEQHVAAIAENLAANALVEYLGSAAQPPRDITAWIMDRDLINPDDLLNVPVEVRVLLKKRELNDLIIAMESTLKAFKRAQLTGMQFFDALQGVLTQAVKGGEKINVQDAKRLSDSGFMPDWIASLPYRSALLEMSNELWESLAAEDRSKIEYETEAKLKLYQEINENTDLWIAFDERDAAIDHVYPLPLATLP
jgi:hypothetical protein